MSASSSSSSSSSSTRTLGLHERYAVARRCVDSASIVSAAAILQLGSTRNHQQQQQQDTEQAFEELRSHLAHRIDHLLEQYPLLGYCVQGSRSKSPCFAPVVPTPSSKNIFRLGAPISWPVGASDASTLLSQALSEELLALPKSTQLEKGPLWRVQLSRIQAQLGKPACCLVVLSTDHVLNDGRGTLNLFQMLLSSEVATAPTLPPPSAIVIPPASDKVFNFRPSILYVLSEAWRELFLPVLPLPQSIKAKLLPPKSWPASTLPKKRPRSSEQESEYDIVRMPKQCTPSLGLILVSAPNLIRNIKQLARAHVASAGAKPATVHSIIHSMALIALYAAIAQSHQVTFSDLWSFELVLTSATPISLREEARPVKRRRGRQLASDPLPSTTGNYVSSYAEPFRIRPADTFWSFTHRFAGSLASPQGQRFAKEHLGILAYLPDFDTSSAIPQYSNDEDQVEASLGSTDGKYYNGWERFFGQRAASTTPFDSALTVSNLGLVDLSATTTTTTGGSAWKVANAAWAQSHTPQGEAFGVDIVGYINQEDGERTENLSIAVSGRPAAFADPDLYGRFKRYLERLVLEFAADRVDGNGKLSCDSSQEHKRLDMQSDPSFASLARFLMDS